MYPFLESQVSKHSFIYDGISLLQNSGQVAPLDEIVRLKEKYRFRLIMDESNSFGVLGNSGRGLSEHCGVPVCPLILFELFFSLLLFVLC